MHLSAWLPHPGQPPVLQFFGSQKIGAHQLVTWSLIFFAANAKQPQDQLGDFADEYEEQGNDETDSPLLSGQ